MLLGGAVHNLGIVKTRLEPPTKYEQQSGSGNLPAQHQNEDPSSRLLAKLLEAGAPMTSPPPAQGDSRGTLTLNPKTLNFKP